MENINEKLNLRPHKDDLMCAITGTKYRGCLYLLVVFSLQNERVLKSGDYLNLIYITVPNYGINDVKKPNNFGF